MTKKLAQNEDVIENLNSEAPAVVMTEEQQAFEEFRAQFWKVIGLFGSILSLPIILGIAMAHGIRAGIVVMLRKTLSMLQSWEGEA